MDLGVDQVGVQNREWEIDLGIFRVWQAGQWVGRRTCDFGAFETENHFHEK